jgi:hypothetical protein
LQLSQQDFEKLTKQRDNEMKPVLARMDELKGDMIAQTKHATKLRSILAAEQHQFFMIPSILGMLNNSSGNINNNNNSCSSNNDNNGGINTKDGVLVDCGNDMNISTVADMIAKCITQHLIYPRIAMSPIDAVYCTQFLLLLHELQTPYFSTLHCFDRTLRTISPLIFCSTEAEASFIAYALQDLLQIISKWYESENNYDSLAKSMVGFQQGYKLVNNKSKSNNNNNDNNNNNNSSDKAISGSKRKSTDSVDIVVNTNDVVDSGGNNRDVKIVDNSDGTASSALITYSTFKAIWKVYRYFYYFYCNHYFI